MVSRTYYPPPPPPPHPHHHPNHSNDGARYMSSRSCAPYLSYPERRYQLPSHDARAITMADPQTDETTPPRKRIAVAVSASSFFVVVFLYYSLSLYLPMSPCLSVCLSGQNIYIYICRMIVWTSTFLPCIFLPNQPSTRLPWIYTRRKRSGCSCSLFFFFFFGERKK